jgi:hypothetical protein
MTAEERDRIWQHRLHEDTLFDARQNFFLLSASFFAVAYATLLAAGADAAALALSIFGLLVTILWLYVNHRHRTLLAHIHRRARASLPEFDRTYRDRPLPRPLPLIGWPVTSTDIVAYIVPCLVMPLWPVFLVQAAIRVG